MPEFTSHTNVVPSSAEGTDVTLAWNAPRRGTMAASSRAARVASRPRIAMAELLTTGDALSTAEMSAPMTA